MRIAIIGNGDFIPAGARLADYDCLIAADGGLHHCQKLGINPNYCIGDGDSLTETDKITKVVTLASDQNTTDVQKALALAANLAGQQSYTVDLFSMTSGSRLDHTLFALQLLASTDLISTIYTPEQSIRCLRSERIWHNAIGQTISLLPMEACATVVLTGFVWSGEAITLDQTRPGISNLIAADQASVRVTSGRVLCFESVIWT